MLEEHGNVAACSVMLSAPTELNKLLFHLEQQNAVIDTARFISRAAINGAHEMSVMLLVERIEQQNAVNKWSS